MPRLPLLLPLPLLLLACGSENKLSGVHDNDGADGPVIDVSPQSLDFGSLGEGEVGTMTFTVSNVGPEGSILNVSGIDLSGTGAASFTLLSTNLEFTLEAGVPGEEIEVAFTPLGSEPVAQALVYSDDPATPTTPVDLMGAGSVPELEITPDPLDMGTGYIGCEKDNVVTLTNIGTDTLDISSVTQGSDADAIVMTNGPATPFSLLPGEYTEVNLRFTPTFEGDFAGRMSVMSNEPMGTRNADQSGEGRYAGAYTDNFEVPTDPPADIVFLVDQSCSMDDDARALGDNFSSFITQLSSYTSDWHVMVVNDDDGCNNSGVLTASTSSYESRFQTAASSNGGGIWTEALLTIMAEAIDKTDSSECNSGFLRTDALLHVIFVSDEAEQSWGSWDSYVNRVVAKKGDASKVKLSAIAGDYPSGCNSGSNSADYGRGYYEAVNDTGGLYISICSNWSSMAGALADASITETTFELTRTPDPSTITVDVNGVNQPNGWNYDAGTNAVVFDEAFAAEGGDTVDVSYSALASCD